MSLRLTQRGRLVQRLVLAVVGAAFGILVSATNHGFGPAPEYVSKVIGNGWAWLAAGLGACLLGRGWRRSWLSGVVFFWPAVVGYYIADMSSGVYTSTPSGDATSPAQLDLLGAVADIVGYVIISALASAVLAVVVLAIRRGGTLGLLGALAVPGYIAYAAFSFDRGLKALPAKFQDPIATTVNWYLGVAALTATVLILANQLRHLLRPRQPQAPGRPLHQRPRTSHT